MDWKWEDGNGAAEDPLGTDRLKRTKQRTGRAVLKRQEQAGSFGTADRDLAGFFDSSEFTMKIFWSGAMDERLHAF